MMSSASRAAIAVILAKFENRQQMLVDFWQLRLKTIRLSDYDVLFLILSNDIDTPLRCAQLARLFLKKNRESSLTRQS